MAEHLNSHGAIRHRLRLGGVRAGGAGYPNAERTIQMLRQQAGIEILDQGYVLPDDVRLWRVRDMSAFSAALLLFRLAVLNFCSVFRVFVAREWRGVSVYVPYPSIFFLWLMSWVPKAFRPRCFADAYVSIWDALFRDRGKGAAGWRAQLVHAIERRALRAASAVLVDTQANAAMAVREFGLAKGSVHAWPLAIDEGRFLAIPPSSKAAKDEVGQRLRVLFVGTLVPLHGISVLIGALRLLQADDRLEFRIVGDGQMGCQLEAYQREAPIGQLVWIRDWCTLDAIATEIEAADICLGVFGGSEKASRVLPFKLYMYLAAGKSIVTQEQLSTPQGVPPPPVAVVSANAEALSQAISRLADERLLRQRMGDQAREYYLTWLSNERLRARWRELMQD